MEIPHIDVIIVGAGLSGIGAAYHLQKRCPTLNYVILEARAEMGGTWNLFKYPGIRSDSDMFTLGYSFRPWEDRKAIADGPSILRYIKDTAKAFKIDEKILYQHKITAAAWSSQDRKWTVDIERADGREKLSCSFLLMCSGYYDYDCGFLPDYPGLSTFQGQFIHPQHWDPALDYAGKNVVVIGSGATAVTLVPELAKRANHVTMLQRSPSYFAALPSTDHVAEFLKENLNKTLAYHLIRWKNIFISLGFFAFCRVFPFAARRLLMMGVKKELQGTNASIKDFKPKYDPWDQRLCIVPDGDLFQAVRAGKADVLTDAITTFTPTGLQLKSARHLNADLVISATGLKVKFLAGIPISVDGEIINPRSLLPYKGAMFSGIPNLAMTFGYTNASWTLKCDLIGEWVAKVLAFMQRRGYSTVRPDADPGIRRTELFDLSSGYIQRAKDSLPQQGLRAPWKMSQNYFADLYTYKFQPIDDEGLAFS
jgi:cation diffusion facilitator CzcD-associated flavoprotein CzcO